MKLPGLALTLLLVLNGAAIADKPATDKILATTTADISSGIRDLAQVRLLSTDQPDKASLALVRDSGFVAVVDLRGPGESRGIDEAAIVESLGMQYFAVPVTSPSDLTSENADSLSQVLASVDGPVLLHCASGNRVGALLAVRARQQGATVSEALAVGKQAGLTHWEQVVVERLSDPQP